MMSKQQSAVIDSTKSAAFKSLIERCNEARKTFERSEVDYLEFLSNVEAKDRNVWIAVAGSFEDFLESYVGRPDPSRYRNFTASVSKFGIAKLRELGLDMCVQMLKVPESKLSPLERAAKAWSNEHGGVHPSGRYAQQLRQQVAPAEVIPMPVRRLEELEKLREENASLRRECELLKKEAERMKKEIERLKKK